MISPDPTSHELDELGFPLVCWKCASPQLHIDGLGNSMPPSADKAVYECGLVVKASGIGIFPNSAICHTIISLRDRASAAEQDRDTALIAYDSLANDDSNLP